MALEVHPATATRFDDVAVLLGPKDPASSVCWCLSHRLDARTNRELVGPARGEHVRALCERDVAPGVLAYDGDEVVGWAAVAPRSELPFARSTKIPQVDDLPVWSAWCLRVRPGHRGRGVSQRLLEGAVAYARSQGAPAVELAGTVDGTTTYLFDMTDLDAPALSGTYRNGNTSIDHNIFVSQGLAYQSNYTSGLRITDTWKAGQGRLTERGFFDVYPKDDATAFAGTWSNYPYFASGTVVVTGTEEGLFVLKPRVKSSDNDFLKGGKR